MMMTITQADASSLEEWVQLSAKLFPDEAFDELHASYVDFLTTQKEIGFLYWINHKSVAFMNVSIRHDYVNGTDSSPVAFIEALYVLPEYRRRGIARELIAQAEQFAKENGITQLASDCLLQNADSELFHKSCGFEEKERVVCFVKKV